MESIAQNEAVYIHCSCLQVSECCFKDLSFDCFNSYSVMACIFAEQCVRSLQGIVDFRQQKKSTFCLKFCPFIKPFFPFFSFLCKHILFFPYQVIFPWFDTSTVQKYVIWEYVQMASFTHFPLHSVKRYCEWFHSHSIGEKVETQWSSSSYQAKIWGRLQLMPLLPYFFKVRCLYLISIVGVGQWFHFAYSYQQKVFCGPYLFFRYPTKYYNFSPSLYQPAS